MKKRIIGLFLALTLIVSNMSVMANTGTFSDVATTNWARVHIEKLSTLGIINGYPDGTFKPGNTLKVNEFVKMVIVALNEPVDQQKQGETWDMPYINKAVEIGILPSKTNFFGKKFDTEITREEMSYIIYFAEKRAKGEVTHPGTVDFVKGKISDYSTISTHLQTYVVAVYGIGVLTGYPDGTFGPKRTLRRDEGAAVIIRFIDAGERIPAYNVRTEPNTPEKYPIANDKTLSVQRISFDTITVARNYKNPGYKDLNNTVTVKAPTVGGKARTELLDFVMLYQNYQASKYMTGNHVFKEGKEYISLGKNLYMYDDTMLNKYSNGFITELGFIADKEQADREYRIRLETFTSLNDLYNFSLDNLSTIPMYFDVNMSTQITTSKAEYSKTHNALVGAYDVIIYYPKQMNDNLKADLYYAMDLLFEKESYIVKNHLDYLFSLDSYTFNEKDAIMGEIINGRAVRLGTDQGSIILNISLQDFK